MAQKTIIRLVDDLDNRELNGDGQTVTFGFQKTEYEIDLSEQNVKRLHDALAPFIAAGRRVGSRAGGNPGAPKADHAQLQAMRQWAKEQGMKVSDRGRVSREVQEAYHAAH
ncbi:MAG TPA: Lsr2 family protein [Propionibacteriaceae bacterium]|nr:Lsr2 family protein [Propionibacteriaceae bacterium]